LYWLITQDSIAVVLISILAFQMVDHTVDLTSKAYHEAP
jgi:hypothetical protein